MKENLKFFLEVNKLKETQRTGWVLMKVKNPETIAEHTFRVAIEAWFLGEKKKLNVETIIKTAIAHDLCEVYAGDKTPFFYWDSLDKSKGEQENLLLKGIRLSQKEKEKRGRIKFKKEQESLLKLIKSFNSELKREIYSLWFDFEKRLSQEGKFVKQVDRIETLLQAIEYFEAQKKPGGTSWWELTEEIVEDPLLLDFLKVIQNKFYGHKKEWRREVEDKELEKELNGILDFFLEIGKLKRFPRKLWVQLGIENPETVAEHIFTLALMAWIFGNKEKNLKIEKLLKMALCHEIPSVYTGDLITPYERVLFNTKKGRRKVFEKWPRLTKKEKEKNFLKDYKKEKKALKKLTKSLPQGLREEIISLFDEYKTTQSAEARFLNQLNVLAVLFQELCYRKEDKGLPIGFLWEWAFEKCDNKMCLEFLEELKRQFL
ncbi:HD domain-containing protein [bacterium]|nr:HD domain-containing protein [bacterium]